MSTFNIRNRKVTVDDTATVFSPRSPRDTAQLQAIHSYLRRYERQEVDVPVLVRLATIDGVELDRGTAVIRDMTPDGAFLADLQLLRGVVPIEPFELHFRVTDGDLRGVEGSCRPVRFQAGQRAGLGVQFKDVFVRILGEDLEGEED